MDEFYGENFKCVFDFANYVQCKQDTKEACELLKDYIAYIHVKDADGVRAYKAAYASLKKIL